MQTMKWKPPWMPHFSGCTDAHISTHDAWADFQKLFGDD
jgi:hypothetical protein